LRVLTKEFFESSSIERTKDSVEVMDFLASSKSIQKMLAATEKGFPALSGVVAELEEKYAFSEKFPLHHEAADKNAKNRRNVGWMVRFIMRKYGYTPVDNFERTRIGTSSGSKYFGNAAVYRKTENNPSYVSYYSVMQMSYDWKSKDMYLKRGDLDYDEMKNRMKAVKLRMKKISLPADFLASYVSRTGFNHCVSLADMDFMLLGTKVPSVELVEAFEEAMNLFEFFDK